MLPLLTNSRNVATGTYLAEQISTYSYDLVASCAKPSQLSRGRSGAVSPSPGGPLTSPRSHKKKNRAEKFIKCTELPALENIDALFANTQKNNGETASQGSEELRETILSQANSADAAAASPGDGGSSDEEFKGWLQLPKICENAREASSTRQGSPTGEGSWHLLLSHKTFRSYSDQHVVDCLMQVLRLSLPTAEVKVAEARKTRLVVVQEFVDKGEAFEKMQNLRSHGLQVQIAMDYGLPGDGQGSHHSRVPKQPVGAHMRSYTELFFKAGADRSSGNRHACVPLQRIQNRVGLNQWRAAQRGNLVQSVLPEDPVEALFEQEQEISNGRPSQGNTGKFQEAVRMVQKQKHKPREPPKRKTVQRQKMASTFLHAMGVDVAAESAYGQEYKPKEATPARKEACLLMRFFVFGHFGSEEAATTKEQEALFHETIGTKEQVHDLHRLWTRIDEDYSGRADYLEFKAFAEKHIHDLMGNRKSIIFCPRPAPLTAPKHRTMQKVQEFFQHAMEDIPKFISGLHEKLAAQLLGKKSSFSIEEIMRLMFLGARQPEVKIMKDWCREFSEEYERNRVMAPPVLDAVEYQGLCSVFEHFDEHKKGEIAFETLVTKGLIYADQVDEYQQLWDENGDGVLSLREFCEMMCPVGFRATKESEVGFLPDGRRVKYEPDIKGWTLRTNQIEDRSVTARADGTDLE